MHVKYLHHRIFAQRMHTDNFIVGDHEAKLDSVVNGLDELCPVVSNGRNYEWYYAAVNKRSPGQALRGPIIVLIQDDHKNRDSRSIFRHKVCHHSGACK
mmetsp:Transcript_12876/g.50377  ORF Transcript_12876/g.50377 Transcript_12876/m.50377 type:complete len:99 (-) Transcript_12876:1377-1673(-)